MIRFIPGLAGAIVAFICAKLAALLGGIAIEVAVFVITYAVASYAVDASMKRYGRRER